MSQRPSSMRHVSESACADECRTPTQPRLARAEATARVSKGLRLWMSLEEQVPMMLAEVFGPDLLIVVIVGMAIPLWAIIDALSRPAAAFYGRGNQQDRLGHRAPRRDLRVGSRALSRLVLSHQRPQKGPYSDAAHVPPVGMRSGRRLPMPWSAEPGAWQCEVAGAWIENERTRRTRRR